MSDLMGEDLRKNRSSVIKAKTFLKNLGLSYEKTSNATQKYLLDMIPSGSHDASTVSGSAVAQKFNDIVNTNMVGGRVSLPLEYFGVETSSYNGPEINNSIPTDATLLRQPLHYTGGGNTNAKLFTQSDLDVLHKNYEKKFGKKLKLSKTEKTALLKRINADITKAVVDAVKDNKYGRLTKEMLKKKLKM